MVLVHAHAVLELPANVPRPAAAEARHAIAAYDAANAVELEGRLKNAASYGELW